MPLDNRQKSTVIIKGLDKWRIITYGKMVVGKDKNKHKILRAIAQYAYVIIAKEKSNCDYYFHVASIVAHFKIYSFCHVYHNSHQLYSSSKPAYLSLCVFL